ncbi:MAG: glycosyltransferase family 25 protein, partial [Dialister sp.]|nr:glycosyltransferase family 25 protein [Dialister sp.]
EIGCALSHLQLYQYMIDEDIPYLMIVEDDVVFTPELVTLLPKIEDFVFHHLRGTPAVLHLCKQYQYLHEVERLNDRISLYATQYALGAPCYIITLEAAANILKIQTPLRWEIDMWKFYYYLGALKLFAPNEDLTHVAGDVPSVITSMGKRISTKKTVSRRKKRFLSYMLSNPQGYRQLLFYLYCKLRKSFTTTHDPESLRRSL